MKEDRITLIGLTLKSIVSHTLTYFLVGLVASIVFNYSADFARPELRSYMRQIGDPMIALGPALQPIRGLLFALAFYPLRELLFRKKNGWLITWWLLVALGIFPPLDPPLVPWKAPSTPHFRSLINFSPVVCWKS